MVLAISGSCGLFCMVVAGFIWLLMVMYGVRCFLPALDGSLQLWPDPWIDFSSSALI